VHKNYLPALQKFATQYWLNVENVSRFVLCDMLSIAIAAISELKRDPD
jgi:hypothetical protein